MGKLITMSLARTLAFQAYILGEQVLITFERHSDSSTGSSGTEREREKDRKSERRTERETGDRQGGDRNENKKR